MDKKKCEICGTSLSMYNKGKRCYTHTEGNAVIERTPVTNCTSYKAREDHRNGLDPELDADSMSILPVPGTPNYDNMAFDKEVTGIVNADGKLELFDEPLTLADIEEEE
jgi:hypothetical protein